MVGFIDDHRGVYGVESICAVLPIAPSTYFRHKAQQADPTRRSARAQRDEELRAIIRRIWTEHLQVYGPREVPAANGTREPPRRPLSCSPFDARDGTDRRRAWPHVGHDHAIAADDRSARRSRRPQLHRDAS